MSQTESLIIGGFIFDDMDQADLTGPFEVLSRVPNSTFHVIARTKGPIRDVRGLVLTPTLNFSESPQLVVLLVPGGSGVNALMEDDEVLSFLRRQAANSRVVLSGCTGALLCGAAGLLVGKRATTHWASQNLLPLFGALPVDARVVEDGSLVCAAGVTSGIDAALRVAAILRGDEVAKRIQLYMRSTHRNLPSIAARQHQPRKVWCKPLALPCEMFSARALKSRSVPPPKCEPKLSREKRVTCSLSLLRESPTRAARRPCSRRSDTCDSRRYRNNSRARRDKHVSGSQLAER
jgi:cyclohexyl-isocyanide hydratase